MPTRIFIKGREDVFYGHLEGDIIVDYYLICEFDENFNIVKACSFGYSAEKDIYFLMDDPSRFLRLRTLFEAEQYDVSRNPASIENEKLLYDVMDIDPNNNIFNAWMDFHYSQYKWLYEEDEYYENNKE